MDKLTPQLIAQTLVAKQHVSCLLTLTLMFASLPLSITIAEETRGEAPEGMVWIPTGEFSMGSDHPLGRRNELPIHRVKIDGFWMDRTEVTNAQFAQFVEATGYQTVAERAPTAEEINALMPPGSPPVDEKQLFAASLVFMPTRRPIPLHDVSLWWSWTKGANWRHPEGPESSIEGKDDYPVVQVAWVDAKAYADWAGKRLPSEAEWEYAARGGLDGMPFVWGDEPLSDTEPQTNIWQGNFPNDNKATDGYKLTSPVGTYPANGYGLVDVAGNVWEWTNDWYRPDTYARRVAAMKANGATVADNPKGPASGFNPQNPNMPERIQRGGSYLCSDQYCASYRPAARMACSPDTGLSHLGFRCAMSAPTSETMTEADTNKVE